MPNQILKFISALWLIGACPVAAQGWQGAQLGITPGGVFSGSYAPGAGMPDAADVTTRIRGPVHVGYGLQRGSLVLGAVADLARPDARGRAISGPLDGALANSLRLRAGLSHGETLIFGSLGMSWDATGAGQGAGGNRVAPSPGLIFGAGAERALRENLSGRIEAYLIDTPGSAGTPSTTSQTIVFRTGLTLQF